MGEHITYQEYLADHSASDVFQLLCRSGRRLSFQHNLLDSSGNVIGSVPMHSSQVTNDTSASVQRTAEFVASNSAADAIDYDTDRVQPVPSLWLNDSGDWLDFPQGVFLLSSPTKPILYPSQGRKISAYDLSLVLSDDLTTDVYTVAAGTNVLATVSAILAAAGLPTSTVPYNAATTGVAKDWDLGTSNLDIVNQLLASINYQALTMDGNGLPVVRPIVSPTTAAPLCTYSVSDPSGMLVPGTVNQTFDIGSIPNVFVGVASSSDLDANGDPINYRSVVVNSSKSSPTSTVNVGREITQIINFSNITDQATLDTATQTYAEITSYAYLIADFNTGIMPIHGSLDTLLIDVGDGAGQLRYQETKWSLPLKIGGQMQHEAQMVVDLNG